MSAWNGVYDDEEPDQHEDECEQECGLMPDGQCMLAGTEHCDWDCGRLNEQRIEAMKAQQTSKEAD